MAKLRKFSLSDLAQVLKIEKASFPNRVAWSGAYFKKIYQEYPEEFMWLKIREKL